MKVFKNIKVFVFALVVCLMLFLPQSVQACSYHLAECGWGPDPVPEWWRNPMSGVGIWHYIYYSLLAILALALVWLFGVIAAGLLMKWRPKKKPQRVVMCMVPSYVVLLVLPLSIFSYFCAYGIDLNNDTIGLSFMFSGMIIFLQVLAICNLVLWRGKLQKKRLD